MKTLMVVMMFIAFGCDTDTKPAPPEPKVTAAGTAQAATEDCDDKAKQKVEIKEETISLTNPTAGCTLDEAH